MYCSVESNFKLPLITLSTACKKSFSEATFLSARMANMPASVHTERNSAPVAFGHKREINSHRMSFSQLMVFAWIRKMLARPSKSGKENSTFRSISPGRNNAGSKVLGSLVANITLMLPRGSNPSNCVINSNMVRCTSLSPPAPSSKRAPPMASTSSKKMMHAFFVRAISNNSRTIRAPSPTYFWTSSEPMTRINVASVSLATARAQSVLPVPGGPYKRMPLGGSIPNLTNRSGARSGSSTTSRNFSICSLQPPMSP
ncbi:hypothetical protein CLUG_03378 [Clavispora lusitaniae ATCC 42720]|uniref:Uncharacterized protein n=1 Tax=Clavispora lusitaniae (strain ATCC 42720) TaxID=306902 RepID=C4Y5E4_CLAL4|nr:uncharacterized protein CLUG_03378 [Clavispora lusitaniae ATCC 42720]EEQ39250.1 hypothetical protein CLUG_03378 [Clavispora lusitaniae ATCC 42720]